MNTLWSDACLSVLARLSPASGATRYLPSPERALHRHADGAPVVASLRALSGSPPTLDDILLTDYIAIVGFAEYEPSTDMRCLQFSYQAYACPTDTLVNALSASKPPPIHYYRLEHHPRTPGPLLAEPNCHLHVLGNGPPRVPISVQTAHPLLWFLEFLTINYDYPTWLDWLEYIADDSDIPFALLKTAFDKGTIFQDAQLSEPLSKLIDIAHQQKRAAQLPFLPPHSLRDEILYQLG